MGEIETGKSLNQERDLARAANTRWGSHCKLFKNFISMFGYITDVLDTIVVDSKSVEEKDRATGYLRTCQTFEVAFILHLMRDILEIKNELNESLKKKEQDITNVILLVKVVKKTLQDLWHEGWNPLIKNVSKFCVRFADYTISHHYLVEVFLKVIDWQLQELNDRFNEFALLLPVATAIVERALSAMKLIKSELRNRMDDGFMSSCMVTYVEKNI
ncbi:uncharacterized protein LOC124887700 [Capsicum annuum]|uniref:uncharacterized protein LOC124887700 n=1 Tax=Capsicum annuum TaxID=4072 RepID=UPI001FB0F5B1|nr:uncharacterized protein LOC124887700 [Capsicum annuum]